MPTIEPIESLSDPRVAHYASLRDAELRHREDSSSPVTGRAGLFMAEGDLVVRRLIEAQPRFEPVSFLTTQTRLDALNDSLHRLPDSTPIYLAPQSLLNDIVGFNMHRGLLALGRPTAANLLDDWQPVADHARILLVLEDLRNHDNLGAIFRNAAALASHCGVLLSPACADPLYRKSLRVSMGHVLAVPYARLNRWPDDLTLLRARGFKILALSPNPKSADISSFPSLRTDPSAKYALLLGSEGPGLSSAAMDAADQCVRIEIAPSVDSLNVAVTAAIALHRLAPLQT